MRVLEPGDIVAILHRGTSAWLSGDPNEGTVALSDDVLNNPNAHWKVGAAGEYLSLRCQAEGELRYLDTNGANRVDLDDAVDLSARWTRQPKGDYGVFHILSATYRTYLTAENGVVSSSESAKEEASEWVIYVRASA